MYVGFISCRLSRSKLVIHSSHHTEEETSIWSKVEEDEENIDALNASQEDEDGGHEVNNNDDEDIDLEIEYENLIGIDLDIGLETMRDVIENEFDEESLPQINDEEL